MIVSEDHKAPVVAVSVWYHVGSANEPAGRTGFAHLFEHLMFQESENRKGEFFTPLERAGATDMNGTTWHDRTNYFQTVPAPALDLALWLESDRMGHLLGAVTQGVLDEQRGVVQNEKRQSENEPYGRWFTDVAAKAFPANHPYHHDVLGSMRDLNAASLDTVRQWFRSYYGAANATLVLVGEITPQQAREKAMKYFGDIDAGPPVPRPQAWIAPRHEATQATMTDNVAQVRIVREWNTPGLRAQGDDRLLLELAAAILGEGKTSRLYQRLVQEDKLADAVSFESYAAELAGMTWLQVDVKKGVEPERVHRAIGEEWTRFLREGPSEAALERAKTDAKARLIRSLEQTGGFAGKAARLAEGQLYRGDPGAWKKDFELSMAASADAVRAAAARWLAQGDYTLTIVPGKVETADRAEEPGRPASPERPADLLPPAGRYTTTASTLDRRLGAPDAGVVPALDFPRLQRGRLKNGIEVVLAERHAAPFVLIQARFDAGSATDQGRKLGTASLAMAMLGEGTTKLSALEIAQREQGLGAKIEAGCTLDVCTSTLDALVDKLQPSLALWADTLRNPALREPDLERLRGQWLARIAQEKTEPRTMALRLLPPLLYGPGNAYAIPLTGSGTEASIGGITRADLAGFMKERIRPDNLKILVAGDTTLARIIPALEQVLGDWQAPARPIPAKALAQVALPPSATVHLVDRPGAQQSVIVAGWVAPPSTAARHLEIGSMNSVLGGNFSSRLNMNLREDKHWAYGAFTLMPSALGQRPLMMVAPVQTDQTAASAAEMSKEARDIIDARPINAAEISRVKQNEVRRLPGRFERTGAVLAALADIVTYRRADDDIQTLAARIQAQSAAAIQAAATEIIRPDKLTWLIVGDLSKTEAPIRALDLGRVTVIDADGKPLR